jgi:hypothetical protein
MPGGVSPCGLLADAPPLFASRGPVRPCGCICPPASEDAFCARPGAAPKLIRPAINTKSIATKTWRMIVSLRRRRAKSRHATIRSCLMLIERSLVGRVPAAPIFPLERLIVRAVGSIAQSIHQREADENGPELPASNESIWAHARISVSWTRSSARSVPLHNEIA